MTSKYTLSKIQNATSSTNASAEQAFPTATILLNGNKVIAWTDSRELDSNSDIYMTVINRDGITLKDSFRINLDDDPRGRTTQAWADIVALPNGKFIIAWTDAWGYIKARIFEANGDPTERGEFKVSPNDPIEGELYQNVPKIAVVNDKIMITYQQVKEWKIGGAIKGVVLDIDGYPVYEPFRVTAQSFNDANPSDATGFWKWHDTKPLCSDLAATIYMFDNGLNNGIYSGYHDLYMSVRRTNGEQLLSSPEIIAATADEYWPNILPLNNCSLLVSWSEPAISPNYYGLYTKVIQFDIDNRWFSVVSDKTLVGNYYGKNADFSPQLHTVNNDLLVLYSSAGEIHAQFLDQSLNKISENILINPRGAFSPSEAWHPIAPEVISYSTFASVVSNNTLMLLAGVRSTNPFYHLVTQFFDIEPFKNNTQPITCSSANSTTPVLLPNVTSTSYNPNFEVVLRAKPIGFESRINDITHGNQQGPNVDIFSNGKYIITWMGEGNGNEYGSFAKIFNPDGTEFRSQFSLVINTTPNNGPLGSFITVLSDDNFILTWKIIDQSDPSLPNTPNWNIYGQKFASNGEKIGNAFLISTTTLAEQVDARMASLSNGGFIATWQSNNQDGSSYGIFARIFNSQSEGGTEIQVNTHTLGQQSQPKIAILANGEFVIGWHSSNQEDGASFGIYAQRFNAQGEKVGPEFHVNAYTTDNQFLGSIIALKNGGFMIAWQSNQDGSGFGIFMQRFDALGNKVGAEIPVNTYTLNDQADVVLANLEGDYFIASWVSGVCCPDNNGLNPNSQDSSGYGVYAQIFDKLGNKVGSEFRVNTYTNDNQFGTTVMALTNGKFINIWQSKEQDGSGYGIYSQIFDLKQLGTYDPIEQFVINRNDTICISIPASPSGSPTPTSPATPTNSASATSTSTTTVSGSVSATPTATLTNSASDTATNSATNSVSPTSTSSISESRTASKTATETANITPSLTASTTPSITPTGSASETATSSVTPTPTPSVTPTNLVSETATSSVTPTFTPPLMMPLLGDGHWCIAGGEIKVVDVNNDLRPDLVCRTLSGTIQILYSNCNNSYSSLNGDINGQVTNVGWCPLPRQFFMADFNGDHHPDLHCFDSTASQQANHWVLVYANETRFVPMLNSNSVDGGISVGLQGAWCQGGQILYPDTDHNGKTDLLCNHINGINVMFSTGQGFVPQPQTDGICSTVLPTVNPTYSITPTSSISDSATASKTATGTVSATLSPTASSTPPVTPTSECSNNLILHLPFNGNAHDESGHNHTTIIHEATLTSDRFGNPNSAFRFGAASSIEILNSPLLDVGTLDYTIIAWVKPDLGYENHHMRIYSHGSSQCTPGYMLRTEGAKIMQEFSCSSAPCTLRESGNIDLRAGEWNLIVNTVQRNDSAKVYINGVLDNEVINVNSCNLTSGQNGFIGFNPDPIYEVSEQFYGVIDDIRIIIGALAANEIQTDQFHHC